MAYRTFYRVELTDWVYGTIEKHRLGVSWQSAWVGTYRELGGLSKTTGKKVCPMMGAKTLYEFGRLKIGGLPFRDCEIADLWNHSRNGSYAILATRLLRTSPQLNRISLWSEIQQSVRREVGDEPAQSNQGSATLAFQLWHLGLIEDGPA